MRERSKEAIEIKKKMEVEGVTSKPQINENSQKIIKNHVSIIQKTDYAMALKKHQQRLKEQEEAEYQKNKRSYDLSGNSSMKKQKAREVLDPEDYENFFHKNIEWLKHRESKIEYLQSEKKRKQEFEDKMLMTPWYKLPSGSVKTSSKNKEYEEDRMDRIYKNATLKEKSRPEDEEAAAQSIMRKLNFEDIENGIVEEANHRGSKYCDRRRSSRPRGSERRNFRRDCTEIEK